MVIELPNPDDAACLARAGQAAAVSVELMPLAVVVLCTPFDLSPRRGTLMEDYKPLPHPMYRRRLRKRTDRAACGDERSGTVCAG